MYEVYKWTQRKSKDRRMMLLKKLLEEVPTVYRGGGGKGAAPAAQPLIAPSAPVEEAGVEIDDESDKKKIKSTKQSLKVPLTAPKTGLNV